MWRAEPAPASDGRGSARTPPPTPHHPTCATAPPFPCPHGAAMTSLFAFFDMSSRGACAHTSHCGRQPPCQPASQAHAWPHARAQRASERLGGTAVTHSPLPARERRGEPCPADGSEARARHDKARRPRPMQWAPTRARGRKAALSRRTIHWRGDVAPESLATRDGRRARHAALSAMPPRFADDIRRSTVSTARRARACENRVPLTSHLTHSRLHWVSPLGHVVVKRAHGDSLRKWKRMEPEPALPEALRQVSLGGKFESNVLVG